MGWLVSRDREQIKGATSKVKCGGGLWPVTETQPEEFGDVRRCRPNVNNLAKHRAEILLGKRYVTGDVVPMPVCVCDDEFGALCEGCSSCELHHLGREWPHWVRYRTYPRLTNPTII
mmetsp:Transcript_10150/g.23874  ORF Transcript_10150/g.23874 Transcript_10150/m.23874 type:complete len:117 (-) Transcript_10150:51-401(-)